jgi:sulfite reductase (ferredoxin)
MKLSTAATCVALAAASATIPNAIAFAPASSSSIQIQQRAVSSSSPTTSTTLNVQMEASTKALPKIEKLKIASDYLREPLGEQLQTEEIGISKDAYQILKYHGSYQQNNRETKGPKDYQFMLRLKQPAGELPPELYRLLDDLSAKYGQGDLRATTRQCFQMHGVLKGSLKTVIASIMNIGSSTVGACGDVSRNVMTTPAPFDTPSYRYAREYSKVFAQLFRPMTPAFSEIWLDGEKAATVETWAKEVEHYNVDEAMLYDSGRGIILNDAVEPIYGTQYLPRKFKIGVTVPGDNSLDLYTNDIGVVVICNDATGELEGFNVMVGGGMGRTHNKEDTFARAADHMGFVPKEDIMEVLKAIVAAQRDHGNRDVRANARMKYLVHTLGVEKFTKLVESYYGKEIAPWRPIAEWKYNDWMGWWEQGDGKLFYGQHIDNGRVKDEGNFRLKSALRALVDKYNIHSIISPTQSIIFRDIDPKDKEGIVSVLREHGVVPIEEVDPLARLAMACPALPLCGLAQTEAERLMPSYVERMRALLNKMNLPGEEILMRMTGCPNGCARPYMAELAFVGDGAKSYQLWLGGSPVLTRTAWPYMAKMDVNALEETLEPILAMFIQQRQEFEAFGDFCHRVGAEAIESYSSSYVLGSVVAA